MWRGMTSQGSNGERGVSRQLEGTGRSQNFRVWVNRKHACSSKWLKLISLPNELSIRSSPNSPNLPTIGRRVPTKTGLLRSASTKQARANWIGITHGGLEFQFCLVLTKPPSRGEEKNFELKKTCKNRGGCCDKPWLHHKRRKITSMTQWYKLFIE